MNNPNAYHILNGDMLAKQLLNTTINRNYIICRECLVDGQVSADNLNEFWELRADFISDTYQVPRHSYFQKVVSEFTKLSNVPDGASIYLWFENDLFCQVNLWFCLHFLQNRPDLTLFRVFPNINTTDDNWRGFADATKSDLETAYANAVPFSDDDRKLAEQLWHAYQHDDFSQLAKLAAIQSNCFQLLNEVCQAHIERFPANGNLGRVDKAVQAILRQTTDFNEAFKLFSQQQGIYGFGDLQFKQVYNQHLDNL